MDSQAPQDPSIPVTLFALLTIWGPSKDVEHASKRLGESIDRYYGALDSWTWPSLLSSPPQGGLWPSEGLLFRQPLLLSKKWKKGREAPDVRVGRVLREVASDNIVCVGLGMADSRSIKKAFIVGQHGSEGFLFLAKDPTAPKGVIIPGSVTRDQRELWEQLILKVGEGESLPKDRLDSMFEGVLTLVQEERMAKILPDSSSVQTRSTMRVRRL